jgi:tRNA nucleotidyltransferase (CCA-adding enzyme)
MKIEIPEKVNKVIETLEAAGYQGYVVGGCVRDIILGREPLDWDVCTTAKPEEIKMCFQQYKTIDTGIKHGTVTVVVEHEPIEVTTFRTDGAYTDGRHPDKVEFTKSLDSDLSRRDFTMNAIAYGTKGLIDPFGGLADIANGIIRCVGNPRKRFQEDSLRVLRAYRFASVLGFEIEKTTAEAMRSFADVVKFVSTERINIEFSKLILGDFAGKVLSLYREEIMAATGPELPLESMLVKIDELPKELPVRLVLLYPANLVDCLKGLKYDNATIKKARAIDVLTTEPLPFDLAGMKQLLRKGGPEAVGGSLEICQTFDVDTTDAEAMMDEILESGQCYSLEQLAVKGDDLDMKPSPEIGRILEELLDAVIEGRVANRRADLIEFAKTLS